MVTKISGSGTSTFGGNVNSTNFTGSGTSLTGTGVVKQVLNSLTSDKSSYVTGTSYAGVEVTPLTLSITPASTSNRVMVNYDITFEGNTGSTLGFRLYRVVGGVPTLIGINTANTSQWNVTFVSPYDADNNSTPMPANYLFVDSPNTTSEVTYKLHLVTTNTTSYTMNLNRSTTDPKNTYEETTSSVTLTEVA
jgi:hypothetical protein